MSGMDQNYRRQYCFDSKSALVQECGEYPQAVVQGVLHPFCSRNCARKYNKRTRTLATVAPMMPIMPSPYPDFNMCKVGYRHKFHDAVNVALLLLILCPNLVCRGAAYLLKLSVHRGAS